MSRFTKNVICTERSTDTEIINGKIQIRRVGGLLPALKIEKRIWEMIAVVLGIKPEDIVKENYYLSFFD